jgi:hypothetical protein
MTPSSTITVQHATAADDALLRTLSQLDSAAPLQRPALLAVVDGQPVAAASLNDGRVVADPFTDSAAAVGLLRAYGSGHGGRRRRRARRFPRLPLRARPAI